ncbi:MAG TPA: hypothetical protein VME23_12080 [Terracidiphilus sp.]|nr:hypothetical protein [Terracidiphilus sp.]
MSGLSHLMDNPLIGLALISVLVLFLFSTAFAIVSCFWPRLAPKNQNFTYVATAVAGLVLTVSSGVLGKPATIQFSAPPSVQSSADASASVHATFANNQTGSFQQLYAWSYIVAGLLCLVVFVIPTPATHDLVKSVALTTLGFLVTIVGGLATQAPQAIQDQVTLSASQPPVPAHPNATAHLYATIPGIQSQNHEAAQTQFLVRDLKLKNSVLF